MEIQEIKKVISQEKPKLKINKQKDFSFITYLEIELIETQLLLKLFYLYWKKAVPLKATKVR